MKLSKDTSECQIELPDADAVLCLSYRAKTDVERGGQQGGQADSPVGKQLLIPRIVEALASVPRINRLGSGKRDFLLDGLPLDAVHALERDDHPRIDLKSIVSAVWDFGELKDGQFAIAVLVRNALEIARGIQQGRDLEDILKELPIGFQERLSREGAETEA